MSWIRSFRKQRSRLFCFHAWNWSCGILEMRRSLIWSIWLWSMQSLKQRMPEFLLYPFSRPRFCSRSTSLDMRFILLHTSRLPRVLVMEQPWEWMNASNPICYRMLLRLFLRLKRKRGRGGRYWYLIGAYLSLADAFSKLSDTLR